MLDYIDQMVHYSHFNFMQSVNFESIGHFFVHDQVIYFRFQDCPGFPMPHADSVPAPDCFLFLDHWLFFRRDQIILDLLLNLKD